MAFQTDALIDAKAWGLGRVGNSSQETGRPLHDMPSRLAALRIRHMAATLPRTMTCSAILLLAALASVLPTTSSWAQPGVPIELNTTPSIQFQTIDGFGASDAWRAQFVGMNWPMDKRNRIADLLFSQEFDASGDPKGIGLSIWRFNITAGTAEQGDASGIHNVWRRGECFQNDKGAYDWRKQQGQQWFVRAAKKRGVEKLLAFPNAPPVHLSANGKGFASEGQININLKPGGMALYATFLVDVVEHFEDEGLFFDYLSPVNEPQWDWHHDGQEGTPALNEEVYGLVKYLSNELSARESRTTLVIAEAGTIGHASISMSTIGMDGDGRDDQARFFFGTNSPFFIGNIPNVENTISAHSYHSVWPIEKQVQYRHIVKESIRAANPDLGYWMSEYCILQENDELGNGHGRDLGMATALYVARIIHHDLTITHAKSWQWWTAMSEVDYKDGLIYLDDGSAGATGRMGGHVPSLRFDGAVRESKLLWVLGNYSRFIRPGMVRVQCGFSPAQSPVNGLLVSAYRDLNGEKVVYVITNLSQRAVMIDAGGSDTVRTYITDQGSNMGFSTQTSHAIEIPMRSVVTIVM